MQQFTAVLFGHFSAALRALLFLRVPQEVPATGFGVIAVLVALSIAAKAGLERYLGGSEAAFDATGLNFAIASWSIFAVLVVMQRRASRPFAAASVIATCAALAVWSVPLMLAASIVPQLRLDMATPLLRGEAFKEYDLYWSMTVSMLPWLVALVWTLIAYWRIGHAATRNMPHRLGPALPAMALLPIFLLPSKAIFGPEDVAFRTTTVWDAVSWLQASSKPERLAEHPRPTLDVEAAWERQPELVAKALAGLAPSRPDVTEVYFVGAATYSGQDVFKREVASARQIMDERLGTRDRSLLLVNHRDTVSDLPLANATNLEKVLAGLGNMMDREKDVLVLFLTSHGSKGELSISFPRFGFNDLTPERLAGMLAKSGIRHRVVIISACHSGSFIPALEDAGALVMTAAHADKTSFVCSNEREWTYFGDALFNHALRTTTSLSDAFQQAAATVAEWEKAQKLMPSEPQIFIGAAVGEKLAEIERRLAALALQGEAAGGP